MMNRFFKLALLVVVVLAAAAALAQSSVTAELRVMVKDPKGLAIRDATVTAHNEARNIERVVTANADGAYQFVALPPGQYTITISAPGFAKLQAKDVTITIGQRAELPVAMRLAAVEQVIDVTTEPELIETQRSAPTTTIDEVRINELPINGRNYINFALTDSKLARDTAPSIGAAPTSGLNVGGQRARANLVNVDGTDAVDNSTNGIRSTVSQEAVQEFQIITDGFNAEYGRASGGVVNIITKAGTNAFHGSAFGYLRNRHIQGVNHFSTITDPAYTRYQTGFTLGGPIKKDRTFYFLSYETTRRNESGYSSIGANNFDLVSYDTSALAPLLQGANFGTVLLAKNANIDQPAFINQLAGAMQAIQANPAIPLAVKTGTLTQLGTLLGGYLIAAGGSAGIAVNGALPSPIMAGAILNRYTGAAYLPQGPYTSTSVGGGCSPAAQGGGAIPCLSVFPNSGYILPASWVPLKSLVGNFPVHEGTSLWSLRLDHRLTNAQSLMLRAGFSPSTVTGIQVQAQGPQSIGLNAWSRTSEQQYRDFSIMGQHEWTIGTSKVNELRFQYARRGLKYSYASSVDANGRPTGSFTAVNLAGYAYFGREPFSPVNRTEERYQFTDNFSLMHGRHTFKWGGDFNYLPLKADFMVNFGGVYNIGGWSASTLLGISAVDLSALGMSSIPVPNFTPVQGYGLGMPSYSVQGIGNPHDAFSNKVLGAYIQDTWRMRPNLTVNYGVRYDVEFTPTFKAINAMSQAAQDVMGITQGIPQDLNNIAPRLGIAWDPWNNGKTVIRANAGMFYDHPLLALAFDSDVADMAQAPQLSLGPGAPGFTAGPTAVQTCLNVTNIFQGLATQCLPAAFNYLPNEQRFNPAPNAPSIWVGEQFLSAGVPLNVLPFGFPVAKNFVYAYAEQASLGIEHDLGHNFAVGIEYNFNGGRHLNRPVDVNQTHPELLIKNWSNAVADPAIPAAQKAKWVDPRLVDACGMGPNGPYVPAAVTNMFRPSGVNPSLTPYVPALCMGLVNQVEQAYGLGVSVPVPFSFLPTNFSNGSSVYHGMTATFRKRMSNHYEFLTSYTWSHAIDDSTDLQSPLSPQDSYRLRDERSNSTFDQRHRFVFSAVFQSGKVSGGHGFAGKLLSNWSFAPILDVASGRPFNIQSDRDTNFDQSATDRPFAASGPGTNSCGDSAVASRFSPTGWLIPVCFVPGPAGMGNGVYDGNIGRNTGVRPWTVFGDLRLSRHIPFTERVNLDAMVDVFNVANRYNVADVNTFWYGAGKPVSAFDPRQFQFALKLTW